jgi:hypothetical protein
MSLEHRATGSAHPSYCSTVVTSKLTIDGEKEFWFICYLLCVSFAVILKAATVYVIVGRERPVFLLYGLSNEQYTLDNSINLNKIIDRRICDGILLHKFTRKCWKLKYL